MADTSEVRALLLQVNANVELLKSNLASADRVIADFHSSTSSHLDDFDKRFEASGKALEKLQAPLQRLKTFGTAAVGALFGESLFEAGKRAMEFAGNVQFVSEQVGTSTQFLQQYRFAASQFGVAAGEADTGLTRFARTIGNAANGNREAIQLFDRLHVSIYDGAGNLRSVEAVYKDFADGIKSLDNPAQKVADTMTAFGRGAAGLVPLLAEGADGFMSLAQAANDLGIVLSPDLIKHSEDFNHHMAALKQVLDAQMAAAVVQNAQAIEQLATSLLDASKAAVEFSKNHPKAVGDTVAAIGGFMVGGVPGAVVAGAGADLYQQTQQFGANAQGQKRRQLALELQTSARRFLQLQSAYNSGAPMSSDPLLTVTASMVEGARAQFRRDHAAFVAAGGHPSGLPMSETGALGSNAAGVGDNNVGAMKTAQDDIASLEKAKVSASGAALTAINDEIAERKREIAFLKAGVSAEDAKTLASKEGSAINKAANQARHDADKAIKEQLAYSQQELSLRKKLLEGAAKSVGNDEARDKLQKQIIDAEAATLAQEIRDRFARGDYGKPTSADAMAKRDNLLNLNDQVRVEGNATVNRNRLASDQHVIFDAAQAKLGNLIEDLQLDDHLATTREQRMQLQLDLLDVQERSAKALNQKIIDDFKAGLNNRTQADADAAQASNDQIDKEAKKKRDAVKHDSPSPMEAFRQKLDSQSINDQLEQVNVDGLQGLESGLTDIITGTKSVSAAFHEMAATMIPDQPRLVIGEAA